MKKFTLLQKFRNKIKIEEGATIRNTQIEILGEGSSICIGKTCIVGHNCYLSAKEGKTLIIKNNCMLSRNVKIMTSDGHPIYQNNCVINHAKDIILEKNIWAADNVTILKGVKVGEGSVLGINATITHDVYAHSIVVGNPAKVVKENIYWES